MSYGGKFAVLSEECDFVKQNRKRPRRNSSATGSPFPLSGFVHYVMAPSKEKFVNMGIDEKMNSLFDLMVQFGPMNYKPDCITKNMYHSVAVQDVTESSLRLLEYKSIDLEARLLRNNLLFNGIPESIEVDDCVTAVTNIIQRNLLIDTSSLKITKAFRIGKRQPRQPNQEKFRHRAILVTFSDPAATDIIMENAKMLKGTDVGISCDYPREIREARQELWPEYKEARQTHGTKNVKIKYPALEINGDTVRNMFPGWHTILRGSRNSDVEARVGEKFNRAVKASVKASMTTHEPMNESSPTVKDNGSDAESNTSEASVVSKAPPPGSGQRSGPIKSASGHALTTQGYLLGVHGPLQGSWPEPTTCANLEGPRNHVTGISDK